ncbi:hypothetical protein PPSIR1_39530 [Plesiocystis pacifica SIR-1]|uniref:Uncharacterized protein n=1 Tax=Plesiocystis pacifica SIR-1 TaxID=391625 RepID=A6FY36_9BACT|nr:hypothetical protein [Plesiocystis pacifica]EDM81415.1 hypothetical protein PPSIR1_39530 [Plesiocystis pacifica SIR-1]
MAHLDFAPRALLLALVAGCPLPDAELTEGIEYTEQECEGMVSEPGAGELGRFVLPNHHAHECPPVFDPELFNDVIEHACIRETVALSVECGPFRTVEQDCGYLVVLNHADELDCPPTGP